MDETHFAFIVRSDHRIVSVVASTVAEEAAFLLINRIWRIVDMINEMRIKWAIGTEASKAPGNQYKRHIPSVIGSPKNGKLLIDP